MHFTTSILAATSLLTLASARIIGIAVPDTIKPGDGFNAIIETENYIQSVYDVSIAFGVSPGNGFPPALGNLLEPGSYYLGPEQSNTLYNITKWTGLPASTPKGEATLSASLFSLYGASKSPTLSNYAVKVTIGDSTSSNYVSSTQV
ncbi:hypothetical protein EJ08DRAFT_739190 [Tothia fuscella]|uniref:Uncharacterized protein n=1 Tax=Tothia fuscella TaxID=1048955 RepID=A0A9P4NEW7_9PEZI|nr:hypothetical protein EJ08DRAFT_739190 [Tothia fuscella]